MQWIILVTSILSISLGIFIWSRNPKAKLNISYGILGGITGLWILNNFLFRIYPTLFFLKNSYALASFVPTLSLFWFLQFSKKKIKSYILVILIILATASAALSHIDGLIVENLISVNSTGYIGSTGSLFPIYSAYHFGVLFYILYTLFKTLKKTTGVRRSQVKLVFIGFLLWMFTILIVSVILPLFEILQFTSFDGPSSLIFIGFIAFAITRYRLMDIRAIVIRTVAFGSIVLLLSATFSIVSFFITNFFAELVGIQPNLIAGIVISILVAAGYKPIIKLVEKSTDKFLFKKTYDTDVLLSNVSDIAARIIQMDKLSESLRKELDIAFNFEKFAIAMLDSKGDFEVIYKYGFKPGVAEGLASYPNIGSIFAQELEKIKGLLVIDEMKTQYDNGEFEPVDPKLLVTFHDNNIAVAVPLYVKNTLIGVMILGSKKSGDAYNKQDIKAIEIIGGQVAVAIDNARLYEELRYFNLKLEKEVEDKTQQLRKANVDLQKLDQAKSEFISIASHQLRTPLTVIKGYISMMREGSFGAIKPKIMTNLDKVYVSNERLIQLVENLLDISRIESGRQEFIWKKVQLEELAAEVTEKLQDSAKKKNLKLTFHKPSEKLPAIVVDDGKIHEVMMNFVDNAVKYTAQGSVDVYIKPEPAGMLTFCVTDTGKGISEEGKSKLFKKFSRGKDSFRQHTEGLGLGLYVATMMMRAHEGKIWADSPGEGKGSSFCFSLPVKGSHKDGDTSKIDENTVEEAKGEEQKEAKENIKTLKKKTTKVALKKK